MWSSLKYFISRVTYVVPVTVVTLDNTIYAAKVEGDSMQPVLNPRESKVCDFVLLNRWAVKSGYKHLHRGDIVVLVSPRDPNHVLIKRIIAIEGDTVRGRTSSGYSLTCIPSGHCWIEGENQERSMDSNIFGPVPLGLVFAKATHIIWPHNRWSRLESHFDQSRVLERIKPFLQEDLD